MNVNEAAEFGSQVRRHRESLGLTRKELAHRVGCSVATIRKIESGERRPSQQVVELLTKHLDIAPDQQLSFVQSARAKPPLGNLPRPLTTFIGRENEVAELAERMKASRLVTLLGPPGVGKTRLVIEVARDTHGGFKDGAWFVELASIADPELVGPTIAHAFGLEDLISQSLTESLQQHLREKDLLLVLDNFEHVMRAAPLIAQLLSAAPRLKALVTSREPLRLSGEHQYNVPTLALPSLNDGFNRTEVLSVVAQSPAVELFTQRAKAAMPSFVLSEANALVVAEICQRLNGLPLAIELAAARISLLTPKELLARLNRQLLLLTTGAQDLPARQQTLRATIDWSYSLLNPSEQALLHHLAVFAGGGTIEAIEAVCQPEEESHQPIIESIAGLAAKSLLNRIEGASGQLRYSMLEMIYEYALEKLVESGEADQWRLRHAKYYMALAQAVPTDFFDTVEAEVIEHLQPELGNLRAATVWSLATNDHAEIGFRLIPAMSTCFWIRGGLDAEWKWLQRVLSQSRNAKRSLNWAIALAELANNLGILGDVATAQELMEESLSVSRELQDAKHIAYFLGELGRFARERDDMSAARAQLEESLALHRKLGDSASMAGNLNTLGEVAVMQEDIELATNLLAQGRALFETQGKPAGIGWSLNHLGHVAQLQGDYAHAIALHEQSLAFLWRSGQLMGPAHAFESMGSIALSQGDASRAKVHYAESLALFRRLGDKLGIAWCLAGFAGAAALDEYPDRGSRLWGAGEGLREQIGCRIAPASRLNRERTVALLREQLGDERFEAAQAIGRTMTLEQAVAYALDHT